MPNYLGINTAGRGGGLRVTAPRHQYQLPEGARGPVQLGRTGEAPKVLDSGVYADDGSLRDGFEYDKNGAVVFRPRGRKGGFRSLDPSDPNRGSASNLTADEYEGYKREFGGIDPRAGVDVVEGDGRSAYGQNGQYIVDTGQGDPMDPNRYRRVTGVDSAQAALDAANSGRQERSAPASTDKRSMPRGLDSLALPGLPKGLPSGF